MIFKSIYLKEGMFERVIDFVPQNNLIHSKKNTRGKTTLLRFMLYGLGYNIPSTKKIKFDKCYVELIIECEKLGTVKLVRDSLYSIEFSILPSTSNQTFVLPEQEIELHSLIFQNSNIDILNNLLGAFYIDQEKGWTLLNRGVVIGSIHFNIEALIRGLSNTDCSELIEKERVISREINKYKQMYSVSQYRESLEKESGSLVIDSYETEIDSTLDRLIIEQKRIKSELKRIDNLLSGNIKFKEFVSEMKLVVISPEGTEFVITDDRIVGLNDSIELLIAKKKMTTLDLNRISNQIKKLQSEQKNESEQLSFFETATQIEMFDKRIARFPLNPVAIKKELDKLQDERKSIKEEITNITKKDNKILKLVSNNIIKYATELGIGDKDSIPISYLFTSNLKELSGAILHKTVFVFRLAYIIAIESVINIKLPIILDSPSGKEVDLINIKKMMDILKRDFPDHQVIIASIYSYDLPNINIIELKDSLIDCQIKGNQNEDFFN